MTYQAVLFDLFDTLVHFDRDRLPTVEINGRTVRSTVGRLHGLLRPHAPQVSLEACYDALQGSWQEAERLRAIDHREVSAPERFADLFRRLSVDAATCPPDFVQTLIETHRTELARAALFPPYYRDLLVRLAERFRLGVVSNFDYTPTALGILEREAVLPLFEVVLVSDAVGWRKPRRDIFDRALAVMRLEPAQALFVGDRLDIDVAGAQAIGMDAAWVNPAGAPVPPGVGPPRFEIKDLRELEPILGR
jgi:FMN phosphatase YigB (HAD superfamily)